jgi:hypothetical protein
MAFVVIGALYLVPVALEADLPMAWRVVGAILALAAVFPWRWAWRWLGLVGASCVYVGVAATPFSTPRLGLGLVALLLLLATAPARRRVFGLALTALVALTVGLAYNVLSRSGWPADAILLCRLATGLVFGGGWTIALLRLAGGGIAVSSRRLRVGAASAVGLALVVGLFASHDGGAALPHWSQSAAALEPVDPTTLTLEREDRDGYLEELRTAGFSDPAYATVALAALANADPESLRRWCPKRERPGALGQAWREQIEVGRLICRELGRWPEEAARELSGAVGCDPPGLLADMCHGQAGLSAPWRGMLLRLAADLLMDAGLVPAARAIYSEAAAAGDRFALRDAVRALLDRSRADEAAAVVDLSDALSRAWLGSSLDPANMWRAWSHSLDFSHLPSPRRSGVVPIGAPGKVTTFVDPVLGRRVATSLAKYVLASGSVVPVPPGGGVPAELRLWFRSRRGFQLNLYPKEGPGLAYGCADPQRPDRYVYVRLPDAGCRGEWDQATLRPAELLKGPLARVELMGEYSVAEIVAVPAAVAQ